MIYFKSDEDKMLFTLIHPALIMIYCDLALYAKREHGIDLVITQTVTNKEIDKKHGRVSSAHREGRAIDIRVNYDAFIAADLVNHINTRWQYKDYHYLSNAGVKRLAYLHGDAENEHIHLAIHKKYAQNFTNIK